MPPNYQPPQYNLLCNAWLITATIKPANGAADITDLACQKYISSRNLWDLTPPWTAGFYLEWHPPVMIRLPRVSPFDGPWQDWEVSCIECPAGSGQYYRAFWSDIQHEGFINEYVMWCGVQCDEDLKSVPPAGGSQPTGVGADAGGFVPPAAPPATSLPPSSWPPTPPEAAAFFDSFEDVASTDLAAHIANSGETWTSSDGTAAITSSGIGAEATTTDPGQSFWVANYAGSYTSPIELRFDTPASLGTSVYMGVLFRAVDASNWFGALVEYVSGTDWRLSYYQNVAGTPTLMQAGSTNFTMVTSQSYKLRVTFSGSAMSASLEEVGTGIIATENYTDSAFLTAPGVGLWWFVDATHPSCVVTMLTR